MNNMNLQLIPLKIIATYLHIMCGAVSTINDKLDRMLVVIVISNMVAIVSLKDPVLIIAEKSTYACTILFLLLLLSNGCNKTTKKHPCCHTDTSRSKSNHYHSSGKCALLGWTHYCQSECRIRR